jgi:glucosamine-6-phosphate deaminase
MEIRVFDDKRALGQAAAALAASLLRDTLARQGRAHVVAATGASQFEFLDALTAAPGIDWSRTVFFHLDEYVGLPATHPASFRRYLQERIADRVHPGAFHFIEGDAPDPDEERRRISALIREHAIDVAFVGIGENGHLAFNDPPADFETGEPYLVVALDDACRRQQLGEGWFASLDDVPRRAISMSVRQVLAARHIVCSVPDARKAKAVHECVDLPVSPLHPASALQLHGHTTLFLDRDSASLLQARLR